VNKLTVGWSTGAGAGKQEGESEDFFWMYEAPDAVVAVVGDFARATGSVPLAQRAPEQLGAIARRLRGAAVGVAEWPRALLYEYGNFLFATNHHDRTPRPCAAVALCIHGEHLVAAQQGDVRLAVWRSGQLYFPLGGRWQQVVPDPGMREAPVDGQPLALGTGTITSPLAIPVWNTRLLDGDLVLCFSDGMEDQFPPARMADILRTHDASNPQPVAEALLRAAFSAHPSDDKTLFLVHARLTAPNDPVGEQIGQLRGTVETQLGQLRSVSDTLTQLRQQFGGLKEQVEAKFHRIDQDAAGTRKTASDANSAVTRLNERLEKLEGKPSATGNEASRVATLGEQVSDLLRRLALAESQITGFPAQQADPTVSRAEAEVGKLREELQALTAQFAEWRKQEPLVDASASKATPVRLGNSPALVADRSGHGRKKQKGKGGGLREVGPTKKLADGLPPPTATDDDVPRRRFSWPVAGLVAAMAIPSLLLAFTASQLVQTASLLREMRASPADSAGWASVPGDTLNPDTATSDSALDGGTDGEGEAGGPDGQGGEAGEQ
jgi:hypothetical protein